MQNQEEFYIKLKGSLEETMTFPSEYMYKFIVPNQEIKIDQIKEVFNFAGAVITTKLSKTGKYISLTVLVKVDSSAMIIAKYKEVSQVEGVISL